MAVVPFNVSGNNLGELSASLLESLQRELNTKDWLDCIIQKNPGPDDFQMVGVIEESQGRATINVTIYAPGHKNLWSGDFAGKLSQASILGPALAQQVAEYIRKNKDSLHDVVICVAYTEKTRMSWYGTEWVHNGVAGEQKGFFRSAKEWVSTCTIDSHNLFTENTKLIINSICKVKNIPLIQFNALGTHPPTDYENYFIDGASMDSFLKQEQEKLSKNFFAKGGHPNEEGHEFFTKRLYNFAKERIIL